MSKPFVSALFPFLRWFPMSRATLRADLVAGITVALVLVPQSMAYAQLAGLPVVAIRIERVARWGNLAPTP